VRHPESAPGAPAILTDRATAPLLDAAAADDPQAEQARAVLAAL
jgi:hypothetical protein